MTVAGVVRGEGGEPIEFAVVRDSLGNGTTTGLNGEFSFETTDDFITVDAVGYDGASFKPTRAMIINLTRNAETSAFGEIEIVGAIQKNQQWIGISLIALLLLLAWKMKWFS